MSKLQKVAKRLAKTTQNPGSNADKMIGREVKDTRPVTERVKSQVKGMTAKPKAGSEKFKTPKALPKAGSEKYKTPAKK